VITIAVIGRASQGPHDPVPEATLTAAFEVGQLIAKAGAALFCGGTSGVMEASCRGARQEGGLTIGVLPGFERNAANEYVDISIPTGLGTARNLIYTRGCDATIMIGGGVGTLNELTIAYQAGRTVVVVEGTGGWADRLRATIFENRYLDERRTVEIRFVSTAGQAVDIAVAAARELERGPRVVDDISRWLGGGHNRV
jgi:uncharacterized protein (TIGR00725 family)